MSDQTKRRAAYSEWHNARLDAEQAVLGAAKEWVAARRWDPSGEGVEVAERGLETAVFALGKLETNRP